MTPIINKELVLLVLQFLEEEGFTDSTRSLVQESGLYFNLRRFEELVMNGDWENVEKYLFGFTTIHDNTYSTHMFFEIRKQKYLEALYRKDTTKALDILVNDFKPFANGELYRQLLTFENFRENEQLSNNIDPKTSRSNMLIKVKVMIGYNTKLPEMPNITALTDSRLKTLINQSLNWQHQLCKTPQAKPRIKTLFSDHSCRAPPPVIMGSVARPVGFAPTAPYRQPASSMPGWMLNPSQVTHPMNPQKFYSIARNNMSMDNHTVDSEPSRKRPKHSSRLPDEVNNVRMNALPVGSTSHTHGHSSNHQYTSDHDLPKTVIMNLNQGSEVKSADFYPVVQQALLLVGTKSGEVMVWKLGSQNRIFHQSFQVWNIEVCSTALQASLSSDYSVSINRVMWSPYGSICGVAYSKHIVHLYNHHHGQDLENYLEIEAHSGSVNDLAFSYPNEKHCMITCGEDTLIQLWDVVSGEKKCTFESHKASVYSVCLHRKEEIHFIVSTAIDGKIKAWLYNADCEGEGLEFDAPGHAISTMAYSADGERFFSCGTSDDGDAYLLEWNESEGGIKRRYTGLGNTAAGIIQFDTMKNRILAAGDEFKIKFWDMDNVNVLEESDANGGLPQSPYIRFNKDGTLFAVSTNENGLKILGSAAGVWLLRTIGKRHCDNVRSSSVPSVPAMGSKPFDRVAPSAAVNGERRSLADTNSKTQDETAKKSRIINEPSHCVSLRLPYCSAASKVSRLTYTSSGNSICWP